MVCEKCGKDDLNHHKGCPKSDGNLEDYENGFQFGFSGEYIHWYHYRFYSQSYILGYVRGKRLIEILVNQAVANRTFQ